MTNSVLFLVAIIVAILMFVLAALRVPSGDRFDFIPVGLAFLAAALWLK